MKTYNLDRNEVIDEVIIDNKKYLIGDIPVKYIEEIINLPLIFTTDAKFTKNIKELFTKILSIKNDDVDLQNVSNEKMKDLLVILQNRVRQWQLY